MDKPSESNLREISIDQWTIFFDRLHDGVRIAQVGQFRFELRVIDDCVRAIDLDLVISGDVDGRKHFKGGLEIASARRRRDACW